jgi:hypothetical protein
LPSGRTTSCQAERQAQASPHQPCAIHLQHPLDQVGPPVITAINIIMDPPHKLVIFFYNYIFRKSKINDY